MANNSVTWLDEYINYTSIYSDAPPEFHRFIGLTIIGAALGDKCFFQFGDHTLYPNIWLIILGNSTFMRKSTSLRFGKNILTQSFTTQIYPNEYSIEKMLDILRESNIGMFIHYEFISFMNLLNRDYMAGMKNLFTELFDVPETFVRKTLSKEIVITRPVISMLAATTSSWFLEKAKEADLEGGFLPRFLYMPAIRKPKYKLPIKMNQDDKQQIANHLKSLVKISNDFNYRRDFELTDDSEKMYVSWCEKHEQSCIEDPGTYTGWMIRHGDYLLKLAMIHQILLDKTSLHITPDAMHLAIIDINYLGEKIKTLCEGEIAWTKEDKAKLKIKKIIRSRPEGISQSEILRKSNMLRDQMNKVLETLTEELYIISEFVDTGADKKTKIWKLIKD